MSDIPQEWIERGADAVYRHAARLGVPAYTLTVGQLVTVALEGAVPLIREALTQKIEAEIHHAADNEHVLDWRCQGVAPGEVVPAVRVDHIRAAIRGMFRELT